MPHFTHECEYPFICMTADEKHEYEFMNMNYGAGEHTVIYIFNTLPLLVWQFNIFCDN